MNPSKFLNTAVTPLNTGVAPCWHAQNVPSWRPFRLLSFILVGIFWGKTPSGASLFGILARKRVYFARVICAEEPRNGKLALFLAKCNSFPPKTAFQTVMIAVQNSPINANNDPYLWAYYSRYFFLSRKSQAAIPRNSLARCFKMLPYV